MDEHVIDKLTDAMAQNLCCIPIVDPQGLYDLSGYLVSFGGLSDLAKGYKSPPSVPTLELLRNVRPEDLEHVHPLKEAVPRRDQN
jgi:hypothetical protein